jgi:NAD(P) transhydrogenase subunit beta
MTSSLIAIAYLISGVLFILALRGLSSPESAQQGNRFGMIGMLIAIITTMIAVDFASFGAIAVAIAIGGTVGTVIAKKIQMTALPQLVAAFHSLVGLAAVMVAAAAFFAPDAFGIAVGDSIMASSLIEIGLGIAIGAITFTGSLVAFAKLQGLIGGKPLVFAHQHKVNLGLGILTLLLVVALILGQSPTVLWAIVAVTMLLGFLLILPIGGADMPVVVRCSIPIRVGGGGNRIHAAKPGFLSLPAHSSARLARSCPISCARA